MPRRPLTDQTPSNLRTRLDLFDADLNTWLSDPILAFQSREAHSTHRPQTQVVYLSMFANFTDWLSKHHVTLDQCSAQHIEQFLDSHVTGPNPRTRHRQRYVRIIEGVFDHLGSLGLAGRNPGRIAGKNSAGAGQDDATKFLTAIEQHRLTEHLLATVTQIATGVQPEWLKLRDQAIVAMMLGGGLKVAELIPLTLNCIDAAALCIDIETTTYARKHHTRLLPFARPLIHHWRDRRMAVDGASGKDLVFPGSAKGQRNARQMAVTAPMHPASIFRRIHSVMEAAGLEIFTTDPDGKKQRVPRMCAQTLRNTFCAMLIDDGADEKLILDYLGLMDTPWFDRLSSAYKASARYQTNQERKKS